MLVVFDPLRTSPSLLYANSRKIPPINQANINPKIPRTSVDVCASEYFPFSMLSNVIQDQTVKLMVMTKEILIKLSLINRYLKLNSN